MKTCKRPWRGSTHSAVRTTQAADSWREGGRVVSSDVLFPLTPALSPWERESPRLSFGDSDAPGSDRALAMFPPLPWGDIWDEGGGAPATKRWRYGNSFGNAGSFWLGSCCHISGWSFSATQGIESSGRRRPIAESPGMSQSVSSSRRNHALEIQPAWPPFSARLMGSA